MRRSLQFACAWAASLLLTALPASAQCVMCYKSVEGANARTIQFLKVGIAIMLVPTLFILGSLALMAYRRAKQAAADQGRETDLEAGSLPTLGPLGDAARPR